MTENSHSHLECPTSLAGKVALVVGGYGAIGATISQTLATAGAICVIAGRRSEVARSLADDLNARGLHTEGVEIDACDVKAVQALTHYIVAQHGAIDVLVNCVAHHSEETFLNVTEDAFDEVYRRTLRTGMFLSQTVARQQASAGNGGSQIHLLSIRSSLAFFDRGYAAVCAAKGGLATLMKQQATELAPLGITVNGVAPGAVRTRKNDQALKDPATFERAVANIPCGRLATPCDVANAVLFLASPLARFVTGQVVYVDGGLTACR